MLAYGQCFGYLSFKRKRRNMESCPGGGGGSCAGFEGRVAGMRRLIPLGRMGCLEDADDLEDVGKYF